MAEDPSLRGWAGLSGGDLLVGVDASCPEAAETLIDWAVSMAEPRVCTVPVVDGDDVLQSCSAEQDSDPTPRDTR